MDTVKIGRDFFDTINSMEREELIRLINTEVGEELTQYLQEYALRVASISDDMQVLKRSFSSMLILGYLLRGKVDAARQNDAPHTN
ncbi:MAG: hypothetical protein ACMUIS_09960 [bacterium]